MILTIDWETVYFEYEKKIRAYISGKIGRPEDVDDLCSEVFLQMMRSKGSFSGELRAISSWIYVITRRTVAAFYKQHWEEYEIPRDLSDGKDIEAEYLNNELLESLANALDQIDTKLCHIVVLHYYSEKTLKEIATLMKMSYPYVKKLHKRALRELRERIE